MYNRVSLESIQPVDRQQSEDAAAELQIAIDKSISTPPSTASTATRSDGEDVSPFADTRSLDGLPARCATRSVTVRMNSDWVGGNKLFRSAGWPSNWAKTNRTTSSSSRRMFYVRSLTVTTLNFTYNSPPLLIYGFLILKYIFPGIRALGKTTKTWKYLEFGLYPKTCNLIIFEIKTWEIKPTLQFL